MSYIKNNEELWASEGLQVGDMYSLLYDSSEPIDDSSDTIDLGTSLFNRTLPNGTTTTDEERTNTDEENQKILDNFLEIKPLTNTCRLNIEMSQKDLNYEVIENLLKTGDIDLDFQDHRGYTFIERAGEKGRLDIADLLARAKWSQI